MPSASAVVEIFKAPLFSVGQVLFVCACSAALVYVRFIPRKTNEVLNKVLFYLLIPALLFSILSANVTLRMLGRPFLAIVSLQMTVTVMGYVVGKLIAPLLRIPVADRPVFVGATTFANCGNLPLALVSTIARIEPFHSVGNSAVSLYTNVSLQMMLCNLAFWLFGYALFLPSGLSAASPSAPTASSPSSSSQANHDHHQQAEDPAARPSTTAATPTASHRDDDDATAATAAVVASNDDDDDHHHHHQRGQHSSRAYASLPTDIDADPEAALAPRADDDSRASLSSLASASSAAGAAHRRHTASASDDTVRLVLASDSDGNDMHNAAVAALSHSSRTADRGHTSDIPLRSVSASAAAAAAAAASSASVASSAVTTSPPPRFLQAASAAGALDAAAALRPQPLWRRVGRVVLQSVVKCLQAPPVLGNVFGIAVAVTPPLKWFFYGTVITPVITDGLALLGNACVPCLLVSLGCLIGKGPGAVRETPMRMWLAVIVVFPPLAVGAVWLARLVGLTHGDYCLEFSALLQWAVPPALNLALLVSLARLNDKCLAAIIFFSYVSSVFLLPLWMTVFLAFLFPDGNAPDGAVCAQ